MVKIEMDSRWVSKEQCPLRAEIIAAEPFEEIFNKWTYTSIKLHLKTERGEVYTYEVKFGDKNFCINMFGNDTAKWLGQIVTVVLDKETGYKRLQL